MRILVVEDDRVIGNLVRKGLEQAHFTVDLATDGDTDLRMAKSEEYGAIVLDVMLPGMDGWAVCQALRLRRITTPILMLTARDSIDDRVRGLEGGAEDLSQRLEVTGKDELGQLAATFNGMIARLEGAFHGLGEANRNLEEAYRKLEAAYQERRRFTGDASHEPRTPLTRIKGSTSLALSGPHDADSYREALEIADEAADAMTRIVQDLLLLARSDAGQLPIQRRPTRLVECVQKAVYSLADQPGAPVRLAFPESDPQVLGDTDHPTRLFVNLLENALRHTPAEGEIRVTVESSGSDWVITVADTGEGIPPEHLPHVRERFYRVDAARTGGRGGTGLGLAICESIVRAHGGSLSIESEIGRGTRVTVTLPGAPAPAATETKVEAVVQEEEDR
jgi:signal transduction histidine kinase